jgi:hypothetical protein
VEKTGRHSGRFAPRPEALTTATLFLKGYTVADRAPRDRPEPGHSVKEVEIFLCKQDKAITMLVFLADIFGEPFPTSTCGVNLP